LQAVVVVEPITAVLQAVVVAVVVVQVQHHQQVHQEPLTQAAAVVEDLSILLISQAAQAVQELQ
jgi:hypothetical protein